MTRGRSLATSAARGAAWTIGTGLGSRGLGLAGTLVLTYFVSRGELGEVSDAAVAVLLANQLSTIGAGQYYISHPDSGRDVAWHATLVHVLLGIVALAIVLCLTHPLSVWMKAPSFGHFLPGLLLSGLLERCAYMPERVLARAMRFRVIGLCRTAGELSYTATAVALAIVGWGGMAIVAGNVVRSAVRCVTLGVAVPRAEWLCPARLSAVTLRAMLRFGLPVSVGMGAGFASRRIDNAIVSGLFGADVVGAYNLAYNMADAPAVQVGEQIGDVLLPSFSLLGRSARKDALVRSTALLALVTVPLAVGLGAVAKRLALTLLPPQWQDVGPMLACLSVLSVVRPVGWTVSSYLLARDRPRVDAALELVKLLSVIVLLLTVGCQGPLWACVSVGLAFAIHAAGSMVAVQALDGVSVGTLCAPFGPPLAACVPMLAAIAATEFMLVRVGVQPRALALIVEIIVGALAYCASALLLARSASMDLLSLLTSALRRPTAPSPPASFLA